MGMSNIKCAGCGVEKPPEAYPKRSGRQTRRGICRACLRSRKRLRASDEDQTESSETQALYGEQAAAREGSDAERKPAETSGAGAASDASAGVADASASSDAADAAGEAADAPKRKRKRKRRRGKRAKKKTALEAGVDEAADSQSSSDNEADNDDSDEEIDHESSLDEEPTEGASAEQERGKHKRKRKRRRRSKKSANVSVSGITEDGVGERSNSANHVQSSNPAAAESGTDLTDPYEDSAQHSEEDSPAKRKRKRKRRRKGKRGAVSETVAIEAEAPTKRPAVRPPNKRIVPFKGPFTYDASILNDKGTGMIRLRGRRETGKRWHTEIEKDIAVRMVQEGAAGIIHPRLIHKLYTKSDFRLLILQRDNYVCRYCGQFGDTIDHVMPKSKGGLSSPMNCVCACSDCNLLKADKLDFPYPDDPDDDSDE
jgi:hypothetical protein